MKRLLIRRFLYLTDEAELMEVFFCASSSELFTPSPCRSVRPFIDGYG